MVNAVNPDSAVDMVNQMTAANNAWSAEQAQIQRDWQERMSNTAHQREVADLLAAGLNPAASASSNGASTPTGAKGDTDTSGVASLMSYFTQTTQALINSQTQTAIADKTTAMNELIARLQMQNAQRLQDDQQDWNAAHPSSTIEAINALLGSAFNRENELSAFNALNNFQSQLADTFSGLFDKVSFLYNNADRASEAMNHAYQDLVALIRGGGTTIGGDGFSGGSGNF